MKEGKFTEAVIHYSEAVKHEPSSAILHSNRSLAFLKLDQLYLAMEDAKQAIKLEPSWPKVCPPPAFEMSQKGKNVPIEKIKTT